MMLARMDEEAMVVGIVFFLVAGCVALALVFAHHRKSTRVAELNAAARENQDRLKSLMIQRGMSATEITQVLDAGGRLPLDTPIGNDSRAPEERIVKALTENDYDGADVQLILSAARVGGKIEDSAARLVETMAGNWSKAADIERVLRARQDQPGRFGRCS